MELFEDIIFGNVDLNITELMQLIEYVECLFNKN